MRVTVVRHPGLVCKLTQVWVALFILSDGTAASATGTPQRELTGWRDRSGQGQ